MITSKYTGVFIQKEALSISEDCEDYQKFFIYDLYVIWEVTKKHF